MTRSLPQHQRSSGEPFTGPPSQARATQDTSGHRPTLVAPHDPPPNHEASTRAAPSRSAPAALKPGACLGRWKLDRVLGTGATATVWAAHHAHLNSPVAIKVFHRHDLPFGTVLGEARAASGIPSPNAIWVYDVDTLDGHHAIVMELCASGDQVARSLRSIPIEGPQHAAKLIAEAAQGVQAAHAGRVFHKDIKPANILVNPSDGRAQITDFGLANPVLWARARRKARGTVSMHDDPAPQGRHDPHAAIRGRVRVGTPEFMAPEQAGGLRPDLSPDDPLQERYLVAMDVYGLGATLYTLLARRAPYPIDGRKEATAEEIMSEVVATAPMPLRHLAPRTPRRLARIVAKAMHRDPFERYASAEALAKDLHAWRLGFTTSLDPVPERVGVDLWRNRAIALPVALLLGVTALSSWVVNQNAGTIREQVDRISAQGVQVAEQQRQLEQLAAANSQVRDLLSRTEVDLTTTKSALVEKQGQLDATGARLSALTRERDALTATLEATETELEDQMEALTQVETTLASTQRQLADAELALQQQDAVLRSRSDEIAVLRRTLLDEVDRADGLARELDDLEQQLATQRRLFNAEVARRDEDLARARQAERRTASDLATLTAAHAERGERLRALEASLADAKAKLRQIRDATTE